MKEEELAENYNKIADWWTEEQLKNPGYGMYYIRTFSTNVSKTKN